MDNEFEHQKSAYNNYVKFFTPELQWTNTIYKDLYSGLTDSLALTKASLGDYYFEQYLNGINENLNRIENEVNTYIQNNNYDKIQKEHIFYHKPLLENRINELIQEYSSKKGSIKEPQIIESSRKETVNPFQLIFTGSTNSTFLLFQKFIENDIADPYSDFSYIFQQMKEDGFIVDIKHKTFYNWLLKEKYITDRDFDKFETNSNLKSLQKSHSEKRLNKYLKLKELLFPIVSDKSE